MAKNAEAARCDTDADSARRARLKSLLAAAEQRRARQRERQQRRPVIAAGVEVMVASGAHRGNVGAVMDADYITSRALVRLEGRQEELWIDFDDLAASS